VGRLRGKIAGGVRRLGYEVVRLAPPTEARRARALLLADLGIEGVVDVGANDGPFAHELRVDGYRGRIISFEPGAESFRRLQVKCADDPNWECRQIALGATDGVTAINIAENSSSSSLLPMTVAHAQSAPGSAYIGVETVELARLDSIRHSLGLDNARLFVKVDVQGYELEVLGGAERTLTDALAIESELSFVELYEGQPLFDDVVAWLREAGFVLTELAAVHLDARTGELLQVNGTFRRPRRLTPA
jgi:FkbM family methyltransferase